MPNKTFGVESKPSSPMPKEFKVHMPQRQFANGFGKIWQDFGGLKGNENNSKIFSKLQSKIVT